MKERNSTTPEFKKLPNYLVNKEILVPTGTNLIINDIGLIEAQKSQLQELSTPRLEFLEPINLSSNLLTAITSSSLFSQESNLAVLYPLNGAKAVQSSLNLGSGLPSKISFEEFFVSSVRETVKSCPRVTLPEELLTKLKNRQFSGVLIIDDVIVLGTTNNSIKSQVYYETDEYDYSRYEQSLRFSYREIDITRIPLNWYAASWLTFAKPVAQRNSLGSFNQVISGIYYKGERGQPALYILSTLLFDQNKGEKVLNNYANKYGSNPEEFIQLVNNIKAEILA